MNLADAHAHLFVSGIRGRYGRAASGGDDLEVYESFRDEHRIDTSLVIGYEGDPEYGGNNEHVARLAAQHDWIVPVAFTPTDAPVVPSERFAGIAVYLPTAAEARGFADWPLQIARTLASEQMVVSVNAVPGTLSLALDGFRALDGCRVLISHLGEPGVYDAPPSPERISAVLEPLLSLADLDHVGVKLSGLYALSNPAHDYPHAVARPFIERIVDAFGIERLYWGSDFSPALDYVSFAQTITAVSDLPWSDSERAAIMGGNLRAIVRRVAGRRT
jgi:L-fuconolactonase